MKERIKATLFISRDKREKIRKTGLSLEEYFNRLYDMFELFSMDEWSEGCFWIKYIRHCLIQADTFNLILNHFDDETLSSIGREVGENVKKTYQHAFYNGPSDDVVNLLKKISLLNGWGSFIVKNNVIAVKNPVFNKTSFLQGYLEGILQLELKLNEAHPDRAVFKIQDSFSEFSLSTNLLGSEEKTRAIASKGFDFIYTLDPEGRVTNIYPSTEGFFDYSLKEIIGKSFKTFLPESEVFKFIDSFEKISKGSSMFSVLNMNIQSDDKSLVFVENLLFPIIMNGEIVGVEGLAKCTPLRIS